MDLWYVLGPIIGGMISALAGIGLYFVFRQLERRDKKKDASQRLKTFLVSYENEIKRNIELLEKELSEHGEYVEFMPTRSRDVMLYTLGEIALPQATDAMRYVVESYSIFDEANNMLEQLESMLEHNEDAKGIYLKRGDFIKEKLNILKWDIAQIQKIMEELKIASSQNNLD